MTESPRTYEGRVLPDQDHEVFDQGLAFDLTTMSRRRSLRLFGGALGAAFLAACGGTASDESATASDAATGATTSGDCGDIIPQETAGPYPGDGSNGPDVLSEADVVRRDITSSFGSATGVADGIPLEIELALLDADADCSPFAGAAVYLWQCDRAGLYSLYSEGVTEENYLRGVQEADDEGVVRFTSIFPACYSGRWPHIHFEVFESLADATDVSNKISTSQIALPEADCDDVYATEGYEQSVNNLSQLTLATDNVFGEDEGELQLASSSGDVDSGYTVRLEVTISRDTTPILDGADAPAGGGPGSGGPGGGQPPSGGPGGPGTSESETQR